MPLPLKALLVALVLNCVLNELALAHLWWAGSGHLPSTAIRWLALLYSLPSTLGFCGMRALIVKRAQTSVRLWSSPSFGLWFNLLTPTLVAFLAWGTAV